MIFCKYKKIFNRLREEIDLVIGKKRLVKESDILNLPYLQAFVKESLRLHPPSPIILRQCDEDCRINGFDLKGKTRMLINLYSIQQDPNSWTDPEEFNPDRFMVDSDINHLQNQMEVKGQMFNWEWEARMPCLVTCFSGCSSCYWSLGPMLLLGSHR